MSFQSWFRKEEDLRPLIPKVRVGYVLRGTRNLRHWLQTASTLSYLKLLKDGPISARDTARLLYRGDKNDSFLVTVNTDNKFGVYGPRGEIMFIFVVNASAPEATWTMNPSIFSKWFIKTAERWPDLQIWPPVASYMRSSLHLNLQSAGESALGYPFIPGIFSPLEMACNIPKRSADSLSKCLATWAPRGITRRTPSVKKPTQKKIHGFRRADPPSYGPRLSEIEDMEIKIRKLYQNPRIARRINESNAAFDGLTKAMKGDPLNF